MRVEGGGWRVKGGGWRVEGGGWRVEGGGWRVFIKALLQRNLVSHQFHLALSAFNVSAFKIYASNVFRL